MILQRIILPYLARILLKPRKGSRKQREAGQIWETGTRHRKSGRKTNYKTGRETCCKSCGYARYIQLQTLICIYDCDPSSIEYERCMSKKSIVIHPDSRASGEKHPLSNRLSSRLTSTHFQVDFHP